MKTKRVLPHWRHTWRVAAFVLGGLEAYAILDPGHGDTFSEFTRELFHVDTKVGAYTFLVGWGFLSAWFPAHILRGYGKSFS